MLRPKTGVNSAIGSPLDVRLRARIPASLETRIVNDPHELKRFVEAQEDDYEQALSEIVGGRKCTHWMWYIFPQIDGLAFSSTSKRFSYVAVVGQSNLERVAIHVTCDRASERKARFRVVRSR